MGLVHSFVIAGRGPAYSGPLRWDLYVGPMRQPRERRGIGCCVRCMCELCRVEEGLSRREQLVRYSQLAHTPHTPTNSPPLPGLAHWTDIKVSAQGSRVGWTPARNNERTNDAQKGWTAPSYQILSKSLRGWDMASLRFSRWRPPPSWICKILNF